MARGQDTGRHPNRQVSRENHYNDARELMENNSIQNLTAILAQHIQRNNQMNEQDSWSHASQLVEKHDKSSTMNAILAQHIQKSRESGSIK
jgi:hypothetical protein